MRVVLLFFDGFGLGTPDSAVNPLVAAKTPFLDSLLAGKSLVRGVRELNQQAVVVTTDASLGIPGIPQSATGQTAIFTGKNAAQILGYHLNGVPNPILQKIIVQHSLLKILKECGKKVTFANMFTERYFSLVEQGRLQHSTTTLVSLAAGIPLRTEKDFMEGEAVYQDITNETLADRGILVPKIAPEEAGKRIASIARGYDFTLFEHFQTDRAGHSGKMSWAIKIIETLDKFLATLVGEIDLSKDLVIITSDHGNIEDLSIPTHTMNPVPTIILGKQKEYWAQYIKTISDITPTILRIFNGEE